MSKIKKDRLFKSLNSHRKNAFIFCSSYTCIKNVLYILENYSWYDSKTLIITGTHDLAKFFEGIVFKYFKRNVEVVFIPDHYSSLKPRLITIPFRIIYSRFKNKILLKNINKKNLQSDIFFSSKEFTGIGFYFLNKLSRYGKIIHIPDPGCDVYEMSDRAPSNFSELVKLFIINCLYGRNLCLGYAGKELNTPFFIKIKDKFFKSFVNHKISINQRNNMLKNVSLMKYYSLGKKTYKILYFDKDFVKYNICEDRVYQKELEGIFKIIAKYVTSEELGKKYKPSKSSNRNKKRINFGEIINDYYPAETLYNKNVKIYLGTTSHALANIEKGNIISLVKLITYLDPKKKNRNIENQELRKKNKIYYPESLEQLELLIEKLI